MDEIKQEDASLHEWLLNIPAKHWVRAHFTGRAKCDVLLNNLCEVFNRQLVGGRDKPIITCLEYIRVYMMKRIMVVNKMISKAKGLLTPAATDAFNEIKHDAAYYTVTLAGMKKYQVGAFGHNQVAVDMNKKTCSCRKWKLTGMPCKHVVAVIWNMAQNGENVGIPEKWVSEVYWLHTWRNVYKNTIEPVAGRDFWRPSTCPTVITHPKHHTQVGRLKKKRRKSAVELADKVGKGGKLTRKGASVSCGKCKGVGHNSRSCTGQGSSQSIPQTQAAQKMKGNVAKKRAIMTCKVCKEKGHNSRPCRSKKVSGGSPPPTKIM
ncbi:uncharacterized protein LOC110944885 [Helianthus annuus]|uniref:uncharacterized protein LOC110944885 n=1 Tax=Helianthus annuus TaxID=4232 RepID=UPI000B8F91F9|nr:uncharacterized protein LOC110944885 [Helianthus annuus]